MVASSGATLLEDDAVEALVARLFPLATVVTPNLPEAVALAGREGVAARAGRAAARARRAGGDRHRRARRRTRSTISSTAREHVEIPVERHDVARDARRRLHALGHARGAARARAAARGGGPRRGRAPRPRRSRHGLAELGAGDGPGRRPQPERSAVNAGESLRRLRERKPLVHQITNYVVMNETANATLALGALPVMAHAPRGGRGDGRARRRARAQHRHALAALGRGDARRRPRRERARRPGRARPGRRRRDARTAPRRRGGSSTRSTSPCCAATPARSRRSSASTPRCAASSRSAAAATPAELAREAARRLGVVASVTGPVDHVSDGERVARDRERPPAARVDHRHRLHVERASPAASSRSPDSPLDAAAEALVAFGVAGEDAARGREGPGLVPRRALRRARGARPGDARRAGAAST